VTVGSVGIRGWAFAVGGRPEEESVLHLGVVIEAATELVDLTDSPLRVNVVALLYGR
jgi:hypothetical protein